MLTQKIGAKRESSISLSPYRITSSSQHSTLSSRVGNLVMDAAEFDIFDYNATTPVEQASLSSPRVSSLRPRHWLITQPADTSRRAA